MEAEKLEVTLRQTPEVDKILPSFLAAQKVMPTPEKNKTGARDTKYADLEQVLKTVRPILNENDVIITQPPTTVSDGRTVVITRLWHISGQWIEGDLTLKDQPTSQGTGADISYFRRYVLLGLLGIATEDHDGQTPQAPNALPRSADTGKQTTNLPNSAPKREFPESSFTGNPGGLPAAELYVIGFGQHKGKRLDEVQTKDLIGYAKWLEDDAGKKKKPLNDRASEFVDNVREYLKTTQGG